jgi:ABC-2 type transport system permease protein
MTEPNRDRDTQRYWPLLQLSLARVREFYREPEAIFWVYVFPLLIAVALGVAFRDKPVEKIVVDVQAGDNAAKWQELLKSDERFKVAVHDAETCRKRLKRAKTDLILAAAPDSTTENPHFDYWYDKNRAESVGARNAVDSFLVRHFTATAPAVSDHLLDDAGGSYINFLIPGLIGINLMGGGLWGVGYATVDMRVRKLLKRLLATPMRKTHFLLSIMLSRLLFSVPEIALLLVFARLVFGVKIEGSLLALLAVVLLGAASFMGVGLLVASRAKTMEAVSGLMNLVMLPMYILSGVFFSAERFPDIMQPIIQALPLTALNDALRAVMIDGQSLASQWLELLIVSAWGGVSFVLALRLFRWT